MNFLQDFIFPQLNTTNAVQKGLAIEPELTNEIVYGKPTVITDDQGHTVLKFDLDHLDDNAVADQELNFRKFLLSDLTREGNPWQVIQPSDELHEIKYRFSGKVYTFDLQDLKILDLARFPGADHLYREELSTPHTLELASQAFYIPGTCDGELVLFQAQHRAGSDLFRAYCDAVKRYVVCLGRIQNYILTTEFSGDYTPAHMWSDIYGTTSWDVGNIARCHFE